MINTLKPPLFLSVWRRKRKNYYFTIRDTGLNSFSGTAQKVERCNYTTDVRNSILFQQKIFDNEKKSRLKKLLNIISLANEAFGSALIKNRPFTHSKHIYNKVNQLEK